MDSGRNKHVYTHKYKQTHTQQISVQTLRNSPWYTTNRSRQWQNKFQTCSKQHKYTISMASKDIIIQKTPGSLDQFFPCGLPLTVPLTMPFPTLNYRTLFGRKKRTFKLRLSRSHFPVQDNETRNNGVLQCSFLNVCFSFDYFLGVFSLQSFSLFFSFFVSVHAANEKRPLRPHSSAAAPVWAEKGKEGRREGRPCWEREMDWRTFHAHSGQWIEMTAARHDVKVRRQWIIF